MVRIMLIDILFGIQTYQGHTILARGEQNRYVISDMKNESLNYRRTPHIHITLNTKIMHLFPTSK